MRIVIDMQGAQGSNRERGIGRYSLSLANALIRNREANEIILVLNGKFPDSVEYIRSFFDGILPQDQIKVWHPVQGVNFADIDNSIRRKSAELIRETFFASLAPDILLIPSLFEGLGDDTVISVGLTPRSYPVAVTVHDLIPLIHKNHYLSNPRVNDWYFDKIKSLCNADLFLAISESSRQECLTHLNLNDEKVVNCWEDADDFFKKINISEEEKSNVCFRYRLSRKFIMYTGGIDFRKNIEGLIKAYSLFPNKLRQNLNLAIVCSIQQGNRDELEALAIKHGLNADEVVFTGFVSDNDLRVLYNICSLFVFPSWHEGFGLPVLEAMRCGAPVIGANSTSIPEIIGWDGALFDPFSDSSMSSLMQSALTDDSYREALIENGFNQSKKFSWDNTAAIAIAAMEKIQSSFSVSRLGGAGCRLRLAYVSPVPAARSGIADYSAELLPQLAKHYDIEVIVAQDEQVTDPWIVAHLPVRSAQWLLEHAEHFDRVLYHFGNSSYHQHMFDLIGQLPGVVVLHDFFLSGIQAHIEVTGVSPNAWVDALYASHGYQAVFERFTAKDTADVVWRYPANLPVLQAAMGVIVHSAHSADLARHWYGPAAAQAWPVIPLLRVPSTAGARAAARQRLGISADDLLVCSFGVLGRTKLNHRLLDAWLRSPLSGNPQAHLVFVGQNDGGEYGQALLRTIKDSQTRSRILITGWADADLFRDHLAAADLAVQLRTLSRGETSAAVLDCMNHGLPTIVNAHGSMADLDPDGVWLLPDEFTDEELAQALSELASDAHRREALGQKARAIIRACHAPDQCAKQYAEAIEAVYAHQSSGVTGLLQDLSKSVRTDAELRDLSTALAKNFPMRPRLRQLFVDVSEMVQHDAKTGIQRVVRNILKEWLASPPPGFRVEPVYAKAGQGYWYARQFTAHFMGFSATTLIDEPIDYVSQDIFLGLDLQPHLQISNHNFYQDMRRQGVVVKFIVYDLLCVSMPENFFPDADKHFAQWLNVITQTDGAICISKSVADELENWMQQNSAYRKRSFSIDFAHLGADFKNACDVNYNPHEGVCTNFYAERPAFLMVGTLEPRKGHAQVLDAFEMLWQRDANINLIIVGKKGWMVDKLVDRLRHHPELNKRLFWFEIMSDDQLEAAYNNCTCLIAASVGEGFGLPLIEAAQHKLPIIARDIPVFREVAGENAFYFNASKPDQLSLAIEQWLARYEQNRHPLSDSMSWLSWNESANQLLNMVCIQEQTINQQ